ncbi:acyltransferase family protein, partial [Pedobacter sp.]
DDYLHPVKDVRDHRNNFDLIRLIAALQVLLLHHLAFFQFLDNDSTKLLERFIWNFPGVNVFFIISGYLIFQSLERNSLKLFIEKRFKRIYPALIICFFLTILLLLYFNSLSFKDVLSLDFGKWIVAQLTIFQFYNPEIVRDFGFSPPNGALWTISVELQFYLFVAILWYFLLKKIDKWKRNTILIICFIISALYNYLFNKYLHPDSLAHKLSFVFVLSYLYFFIAGALVYLNRTFFIKIFKGKALLWILIFISFGFVLDHFQIMYYRYVFNGLSFIMLVLLVGLVFSIANTRPSLSGKILKGNDISYGIYIYQMPFINLFFHLHLNTKPYQFALSLGLCVIFGFFSWFAIEKKVLKR